MTFDINGEFGYELFTALPLVNWYKEQGMMLRCICSIGFVYYLSKYKSK